MDASDPPLQLIQRRDVVGVRSQYISSTTTDKPHIQSRAANHSLLPPPLHASQSGTEPVLPDGGGGDRGVGEWVLEVEEEKASSPHFNRVGGGCALLGVSSTPSRAYGRCLPSVSQSEEGREGTGGLGDTTRI
ncbi:unnamed protein product [Boreogadus saida]